MVDPRITTTIDSLVTALGQSDDGGAASSNMIGQFSGCDVAGGGLCSKVYDWTGSQTVADMVAFASDNLLQMILIVMLALVAQFILKRLIRRSMNRVAAGAVSLKEQQAKDTTLTDRERNQFEQENMRVHQRTETLGSVLYSVARVVTWTIATILVLGELGINLAPLVAGAGIVGVALGFGAQKIVGDFLSGMFMISEDQFGVGDVIDLGEATGTVERITLRTTVLRDIYGTVWHVPNGVVERVGNKSQRWSMALLDVGVAYDTDTDAASSVLLATATELAEDERFKDWFLSEPEVLGVEELAADAVTIRISVRTRPAKQFEVQRELNRRFKRALEEAGIEIPFPQRTVWVRPEAEPPAGGTPPAGSGSETEGVAPST